MKAALLQDIGRLEVAEVRKPRAPEGGILIKVGACAICGTDVKVYRHGHRLIKPPRITGHEIAGVVVEVGKGVEGVQKGDRVAIAPVVSCGNCRPCRQGYITMCDNLKAIGYHFDGGFAEYMVVPPEAVRAGCVNKVPDGLSVEEAALAEPLACCINAQELARVGLGQTVLVIGAGPIGILNIQLAKALGAVKTILADISPARLQMSSFVEAEAMVDLAKEKLPERIKDETGGAGADVVIVACAARPALEGALALAAKRGRVCFFGGLPKDDPMIAFNANDLHYKELTVVGNHGSTPLQNRLALDLLGSGRVNASALITHKIGIEEILKGLEITEKAEGLKVIVQG